MIKNLLNADEDPPPGTKVIIEETVVSSPVPDNEPAVTEEASANSEANQKIEVSEDAEISTPPSAEAEHTVEVSETPAEPSAETAPLDEDSESLAALAAEVENLDDKDLDLLEKRLENAAQKETIAESADEPELSIPAEAITENPPPVEQSSTEDVFSSGTLFQTEIKPRQSTAETIRQSGLAYSAAIVLFGSVVFMMILGWFADLLLGSSPWGVAGGIVLGGIIGFIQFFRITSQIFKK